MLHRPECWPRVSIRYEKCRKSLLTSYIREKLPLTPPATSAPLIMCDYSNWRDMEYLGALGFKIFPMIATSLSHGGSGALYWESYG